MMLEKKKEEGNVKNVLRAEVTWTAVAAIGGTIVVVWNIVKYFFTFCSSAILSYYSQVPIYLLMRRRNLPFSDILLVIVTMVIMILIISFTKYNPILYMNAKARRLLYWANEILPVFLFATYITMFGQKFNLPISQELKDVGFKVFLFVYPAFVMTFYIILGEDELKNRKKTDVISNTRKRKKNVYSFLWNLIVLLVFFSAAVTIVINAVREKNCYLDQNDRLLVADLGEQYIVQNAFIIKSSRELHIDNSCYYIIESSNEVMRFEPNVSSFYYYDFDE